MSRDSSVMIVTNFKGTALHELKEIAEPIYKSQPTMILSKSFKPETMSKGECKLPVVQTLWRSQQGKKPF